MVEILLSALILTPLAGSVAVFFLGGRLGARAAKLSSLAISLAVLLGSLYAYAIVFMSPPRAGTFPNSKEQFSFVEGPLGWITIGEAFRGIDYYLGLDGLSAPLVLITALLTVLVILGSWDLISKRLPEYYALVIFFEGAMIGVFAALNLALFFVFWEMVLVPMFFFIGIWGGPNRRYAAMKFIIFTHVGSTIMLLAFIAFYLFSDPSTLNITELAGKVPLWLQLFASAATFIGFGVKLPLVPLHTWLPDAHVEAPAPISVFLAGLLLKMGGYGFIRVNLGLLPEASLQLSWVFIAFGLLTMFYGALVSMIQRDLKRMVALTSINHMGFVLLGAFTLNVLGLSGAIFQMFNHAALIGLLFMLSGYVHEQAGTRDIEELKGLRETMPRTSILLITGSMAAMGFPVFSSFISEFMVIVGAISVDFRYAVSVAVPLITTGYFLWMIRRTVFSPRAPDHHHDLSSFSALSLSAYLAPLLLLLVFPWLVLDMVDPISKIFLSGLR